MSFAIWLRKMLTHTRQRMNAAPASSSVTPATDDLFSLPTLLPNPPPPPPIGLPNSQPFMPVRRFDSDFASQSHVLPAATGSTDLLGTPSSDPAAGMLHGLLGDGHDWPPWLTTSVRTALTWSQYLSAHASVLTDDWRFDPAVN